MAKPFDVQPTADTLKNQSIAGDPEKSIWVSANAGSGKTHILTQRVLRLLLSGVAPENILCLTYTKAAAAEMKNRVARDLGHWAVMDDSELSEILHTYSNTPPGETLLARARTLFALALETPGGLKISTIHAFCEAALHRFPLEADVPVDFSVIEDGEHKKHIQRAQDRVLAEGLTGDGPNSAPVSQLFSLMSDSQIADAVSSALGQGRELRSALADPEQTKANLRKLLDADQFPDTDAIARAGVLNCRFGADESARVFAITPPNDRQSRFEDKLARIDWENQNIEVLFDAFLTKTGLVPKTGVPKKTIKDQDPSLADLIAAQAESLAKVFAQIKKANLIARSEALLDVLGAIQTNYQAAKAQAGQLDFDDLIIKFEQLLSSKTSSDWVRYKLDAGMTHVLVDESQDTNPDQWRVVNLLVEDFFAGDSAVTHNRTLFGVGDEKQSIFGFQGAEPALFGETGRELKQKAANSHKPWENVRFPASFRTLENILNVVDLVCTRTEIRNALMSSKSPVAHESARTEKGGSVTLWPPFAKEKPDNKVQDWLKEPAPSNKSTARRTAERIVTQIAHWLAQKRPIGARRQTISANDILILVQTRSPIFHEIIRALKNRSIPTPGADRLSVTKHIVVRDLLTLGDVLLDPSDDLSLATLLRSPLFDVSLDALEIICRDRDKGQTVREALEAAAVNLDWAKTADDELSRLSKTLDQARPFEFFAELLFAQGGLKKLHARLGEEIDEIIDSFLDLALEHEQSEQPSLQGFLTSLRTQDIEIKRELSEGGGGVRVMTVHGAKGLEAPIVILADATKLTRPKGSVFINGSDLPVLVHGAKEEHTTETLEQFYEPRKLKETKEYWRKFYVAMTRAEDELYITGVAPLKDTKSEEFTQLSWYEAVQTALEDQFGETNLAGETEKALRFAPNLPPTPPMPDAATKATDNLEVEIPGPLAPPLSIKTIRPSTAFEEEQDQKADLQIRETSGDAESAKRRGTALHALLQHLVSIAPENRKQIALDALPHLAKTDPEIHEELANKALSILSGPDAERLFGANSRAELPIFVFGEKNKRPVQIIGRIDRIIVEKDSVLLVDFKSSASPPDSADQLNDSYKTQMGLYLRCGQKLFADKTVSTAIYWTSCETLMALPNEALLSATQKFNIT